MRSHKMSTVYYCDRKLRLEVTTRGFTLWEEDEGRWLLDCSCAEDGYPITITGDVKQHWTPKGTAREFEIFRPAKKRWVKPKKSAKKRTPKERSKDE